MGLPSIMAAADIDVDVDVIVSDHPILRAVGTPMQWRRFGSGIDPRQLLFELLAGAGRLWDGRAVDVHQGGITQSTSIMTEQP